MRFECWTPKATNTSSEYATVIVFPQQLLFLCAYIACVVSFSCREWHRDAGLSIPDVSKQSSQFIFKGSNVQEGFLLKLKPPHFLESSVTDKTLTRLHISE